MNIGETIRNFRLQRSMSQGDIEKRTGLLRCYLSRVENGHTVPSLDTLAKIAGAMDLALSGEQGNAAFMVDDELPARSALLQAVYVLECVADRKLDAERFLPTLPIAVTVDTKLAERVDFQPSETALRRAAQRTIEVARYRKFLNKLVPPMLGRAEKLAEAYGQTSIDDALALAMSTLDAELSRLVALHAVNPSISQTEITAVADERTALLAALPQSRLRLDAVRFVVSADFLVLR